jgi:hypothetical protein
MEIREALRQMAGGPEFSAFLVARLTAIRSFDFRVTDQAIRHLREVCRIHLSRFGHAPMTGATCISVIVAQVPRNVPGWLEIKLVLDGGCENPGDVAHFQVKRVVEMSHPGGRWTRDNGILVALAADLFSRKKIVLDPGARERRAMAGGALQFELKMQSMRKGRGRQRRAPCSP